MNDAIRLLRAQLLLSEECLERLAAVKKALQENTDGTEVTASVQALEPVRPAGKAPRRISAEKRKTAYDCLCSRHAEY